MSDSSSAPNSPAAPVPAPSSKAGGAKKRQAVDKDTDPGLPPTYPFTLVSKILKWCTLLHAGVDTPSELERRQRIKAECGTATEVFAHPEFDGERDIWAFEHSATRRIVWGTPVRPGKNKAHEPDCKRGEYRVFAPVHALANPQVRAAADAGDESLFDGLPMWPALLECARAGAPPAPQRSRAKPKPPAADADDVPAPKPVVQKARTKAPAAPAPAATKSTDKKAAAPKAAAAAAAPKKAPAAATVSDAHSFALEVRKRLPRGDAPRTSAQYMASTAVKNVMQPDAGKLAFVAMSSEDAVESRAFTGKPQPPQECFASTSATLWSHCRKADSSTIGEWPIALAVYTAECVLAVGQDAFSDLAARIADLEAKLADAVIARETAERELAMMRKAASPRAPAKAKAEPESRKRMLIADDDSTVAPDSDDDDAEEEEEDAAPIKKHK